ncbi:hypothetical protein K3495_g9993 [Podosphaera aphanis]|nr:hypothetical protein K3495_g9993 [Podosphaera aphanis]
MSTIESQSTFFSEPNQTKHTPSMRLTNVVQLSVWDTHKLHELVVKGMAAEENNSAEAFDYKELYTLAKNIYIQVVCPDILASLLEIQTPHLLWKYLETEYKRNTRDSSDDDRKLLAQFLQSDTIKRTFSLAFLAQGQKNVVDILATKDNQSYTAVKQRLHDLDQEAPVEMAMVTCHKRGKTFTSNLTKPSMVAKLQQCTYYLNYFPSNSSGHTWKICPKARERGRKKKHASSPSIQ